jgi:PBP1b-binding outer membrane lipoprotein LpoB
MQRWTGVVLASLAVVVLVGCAGETKRMDLDQSSEVEQGAGMTSQDFRSVAQRMARSMIVLAQIQNASTPPKIAFVSVTNNSDDYIEGNAVLRKVRTELIKNSEGKIVFLDRDIISSVDTENRDKNRGKRTASGDQIPLGADFFLTGTIDSIDRVAGKGRTTYLRLSFRLTDAGNSAVVWEDEYEIKKHTTAPYMYR